jgi:hypothetical protein
MLCQGKSCSQCFKSTCISFNLQDPLTQGHCYIPEDINPPQQNSEILISCIFKEKLSTSSYYHENGGCKLIHNICNYLPIYINLHGAILQTISIIINMLQKPQTQITLFFKLMVPCIIIQC